MGGEGNVETRQRPFLLWISDGSRGVIDERVDSSSWPQGNIPRASSLSYWPPLCNSLTNLSSFLYHLFPSFLFKFESLSFSFSLSFFLSSPFLLFPPLLPTETVHKKVKPPVIYSYPIRARLRFHSHRRWESDSAHRPIKRRHGANTIRIEFRSCVSSRHRFHPFRTIKLK